MIISLQKVLVHRMKKEGEWLNPQCHYFPEIAMVFYKRLLSKYFQLCYMIHGGFQNGILFHPFTQFDNANVVLYMDFERARDAGDVQSFKIYADT